MRRLRLRITDTPDLHRKLVANGAGFDVPIVIDTEGETRGQWSKRDDPATDDLGEGKSSSLGICAGQDHFAERRADALRHDTQRDPLHFRALSDYRSPIPRLATDTETMPRIAIGLSGFAA